MTNDLNAYFGVSLTADRSSLVTERSETLLGIWTADGEATKFVEAVPSARTIGIRVAWAGDRLVYVRSESANGPPTIMRMAPGGAPEEFVSGAGGPAVSRDGRTIVFTAAGEPGFWKAGADGSGRTKLTDRGGQYVLTPDDRFVIFIRGTTGLQSPWIVSVDGGEPKQIANLFTGAMSLAVSPDSTSLAFWSQDEQNARVLRTCTIADCTRTARVLAAAPPSEGRLRYAPDGQSIAFLRNEARDNIWLLPLAGGAPRQLTHFTDGRTIIDFIWSHDGTRLAVSRATTANDIVLIKGLTRKP